MSRRIWAPAAALLALALLTADASGLVTRPVHLRDVLADHPLIFVARVEKVYPEKPAVMLTVSDRLKGQPAFERLPVNVVGDADGKRKKEPPQFLKRVAADVPILIFAKKEGNQTLGFAYTNGTWFQMTGRGDADGKLVWSFDHFEPYLRRTFKGTTDELKKAVTDGLAGKKLPDPDLKEPPGLGPEVAPAKPAEKPNTGGPPLAVAPTVVLIGPLALLAILFPTTFAGLAVMMKRWTVALSISSLVSTVYFAVQFFNETFSRTWWGTPAGLWLTLTAVSAAGAVWAGARFRRSLREADFETFEPRRWDAIGLGVLSAAGLAGVGVLALKGKSLLAEPWLNVLVSCAPVWVATAGLLFVRSGPEGTVAFSLEAAFLWGLTFACGGVLALEHGRREGTGVQVVASTGGRQPRPIGTAWEFPLPGKGTIYSTPLVADGKVYVGVVQASGFKQYGALYCLDAGTGQEVWRFDNERGVGDSPGMKAAFSTPCLADGKLYVGEGFHEDSGCRLFCLDAASGKKLWEFATNSHTESSPCVVNGKVYFGAGDDGVYCLDAATGSKLWNYPEVHVDANPVVRDGRLFVGSGVGDEHKVTALLCLDAEKGAAVWRIPVDLPAFASPVVDGGHVFFGVGNGNFAQSAEENRRGAMLCLNAADGKQVWRCDVGDAVLTKPAVDASAVYFAARDEHVYCVTRADGVVKWKQPHGSPIVASPVLVGDDVEFGTVRSVYIATTGGRLACLDADSGGAFWSIDLAKQAKQPLAHVFASPVVEVRKAGSIQQRRVYVGVEFANEFGALPPRVYCFEDEVK